MAAATSAIDSGLEDRRRAAAAGMTSKAVMRRRPTIFIEIAVISAINSTKPSSTRFTSMPSAWARSSCTDMAMRSRQSRPSTSSTAAPPAQTSATSRQVTVMISPKSRSR